MAKSDESLMARLTKLAERGASLVPPCSATIAEITDVVGDLTVSELFRLQRLEQGEMVQRHFHSQATPKEG